jgi:hypothetical protein
MGLVKLDPDLQLARDRLLYDTPFWARHCATILSEDRIAVPLIARPWQLRFDEALEAQRKAGLPMRAIILKARKLGFSTWVQAKFMQRVSQQPFQYALSIAHLRGAAGVLYDMASLMRERLPTDAQLGEMIYGKPGRAAPFSVRPELVNKGESRNGARWMVLGDRMRKTEASIYETLTAGAKGGGRASTPSLVHGSEVAHFEDPGYLVGLLNAVPKRQETIVVLESTANGFNHFHDRWQRAADGAEDPETGGLYVPLFFGWQDNPENAMPFPSSEARDRFEATIGDPAGGGDPEEEWLIEAFGVTLEQLRWRRITRDEECGGDIEFFHQEHPATPEQAFIGSGNPVFAAILVSRALKQAEESPAPVEGVLVGEDWKTRRTRSGTVEVPQRAVWVPADQATPKHIAAWGGVRERLLVWEHPVNAETQAGLEHHKRRPDGQYVVFADIAQGTDTTSGERDWTAVQVLDHMTRMQVARYRSRIPVHELPLVLFLIGLYYNYAWLAPEVNGPGQGVIDALAKDLRYRRLYRRHRPGDDQRADASGTLLGWLTTRPSKVLMEQTFGQALKDGSHGLRDVPTGREFTTYVEDEKNRHGAQKGTNDDLAVSFMGVHRVADELRPRDPNRKPPVRRQVYDDITGW